MSLLHRITRLLKADIHGILDAIEEPDIMLKQAIREMQEEIDNSETQIKTLAKQLDGLSERKQDLLLMLDEIDMQIGLCFADNNDLLAKAALRKKMETEAVLQLIGSHQKSLLEEKSALATELAGRRCKLKSVIDRLTLLTGQNAEDWQTGIGLNGGSAGCETVTQEDVELAFLKEKQKRVQLTAQQERRP